MDASTATEPTDSMSAPANGEGKRNVGRIEEIQGVVIEAVFPDRLPEINHAITIARTARERGGGGARHQLRGRRQPARVRGPAAPRR